MTGVPPPGAEKPANIERRLKREVWSKQYTFLAVCQASLREVCLEECRQIGLEGAAAGEGGIIFSGKLSSGYRACLRIGSASRVRVTIAEFRAGAREELYGRVSKLPWELLLAGDVVVRAKASASRFGHEGEIARSVTDAVRRRLVAYGITSTQRGLLTVRDRPDELIVRMIHNTCTIRLDLSGGPLYSRGYRAVTVAAPLREDLAYAVAMQAVALGGDRPDLFVDAMTGSGTLAIEAAHVLSGRGPGYLRSDRFAFVDAPWFRSKAFAYERGQAAGTMDHLPPILAIDRDPKGVEAAGHNVAEAGLENVIQVVEGDALSVVESLPDSRAVVVANPPYGLRIPGRPGIEQYLRKIAEAPNAGVLYYLWPLRPRRTAGEQPQGTGAGCAARPIIHFRHGGLRVGLFKA